jgi:hypothetical protein
MSAPQSFACPSGKVCYRRADARNTLAKIRGKRATGKSKRHESKAYECDLCSSWHLTSR